MSHPSNPEPLQKDLLDLFNLVANSLPEITPVALFTRLSAVQQPLEDLVALLCEHSYRSLSSQFILLCIGRNLTPSGPQFEGWLMMNTDLPGHLVTVFAERLTQDLEDEVQPQPDQDMLDLLERLKKTKDTPPQTVDPAAPTEAPNELVPTAGG